MTSQIEKRAKILQSCLSNLKDSIELIGQYFIDEERDSQLATIKQLAEKYHDDEAKYDVSRAALDRTDKYFNSENNDEMVNVDDIYSRNAKECVTCIVPFEAHSNMKDIISALRSADSMPGPSSDANNSIILTQVKQLPIDPITKTQLQNPWKNTICGHAYEYSVIINYIKSKKGKAKCPYVGCTNGNVRKIDLIEDTNLSLKIQESQTNTSILQSSIEEID
ncbi:Zinc-finger of the MIZ type in Nse subunit [Popillia japonica]|uniref:E3 SUMO-protein ligase NSE2 n=1 Tax=Popillia japonica TaxID=7064 RepID=A0AAW1I8W0_POPJA